MDPRHPQSIFHEALKITERIYPGSTNFMKPMSKAERVLMECWMVEVWPVADGWSVQVRNQDSDVVCYCNTLPTGAMAYELGEAAYLKQLDKLLAKEEADAADQRQSDREIERHEREFQNWQR